MPLTQQEIGTYDHDRGIVEFTMHDGESIVRCAISTAAMDSLEASSGTRPDLRVEQFLRLRARIEDGASRKYDKGEVESKEPKIVLRSLDFSA